MIFEKKKRKKFTLCAINLKILIGKKANVFIKTNKQKIKILNKTLKHANENIRFGWNGYITKIVKV